MYDIPIDFMERIAALFCYLFYCKGIVPMFKKVKIKPEYYVEYCTLYISRNIYSTQKPKIF